jgi:hypothetical protein
MPAYFVDFTTPDGPRRLRFTLDADRPLGAQVHQILEEMRQRGVVLVGGPRDELGVYWNGADLELDRSPDVLGVTPDRALELRMRPRPLRARPAPPPEPPVTPFFPPTAYAAPIAGAAGALAAWGAAAVLLADLGPWLPTYRALDGAAAALLGAGVGAAVRALAARRLGGRAWLAAAIGLAAGALGGGVGATLGTGIGAVLDPGYLLRRAILWALAAASIGAALGALDARGRRVLDGAVAGAAGGAAGALLFSLAGPAEFWQALAFAVAGAALGSGLHTPALRRAHAVLGTEGDERGRMEPFRIRQWALEDGRAVALHGATVRCRGGRCELAPGEMPVRVGGVPLDAPRELRNGDVVEVDGARLRFRRLRQVSA